MSSASSSDAQKTSACLSEWKYEMKSLTAPMTQFERSKKFSPKRQMRLVSVTRLELRPDASRPRLWKHVPRYISSALRHHPNVSEKLPPFTFSMYEVCMR